KSISRDETYRWKVDLREGLTMPAVDLQRIYLQAAKQHLTGKNEQTDWALREWESTLDGLEKDPMQLSDRLDWVAKKQMLEEFIEAEGTDWNDDTLHSLDLEYHNIDPRKSLYGGLEEMEAVRRVLRDEDIE